MKRGTGAASSLVLGAALSLSVLLTACGGGAPESTTLPTPDPRQTYNPAASLTQAKTSTIAYHGDWVMVADLMSSAASNATVTSSRYGVVSVSVDASSASLTNAGSGVLGWCRSSTCAASDETGTAIVGSLNVSGSPVLAFGMVPRGSSAPRFVMNDDDGLVDVIDGSPVIAGMGEWTENGVNIPARITFVQTSAVPSAQAGARALSLESMDLNDQARQVGLQRAVKAGHRTAAVNTNSSALTAVRSALQALPQR